VDTKQLDQLRIVAETAVILEQRPNELGARRRRDDAVLWAARVAPLEAVATAGRISLAEVEVILAMAPPRRRLLPRRAVKDEFPATG
jgi:hypothetical protein